MYRFHFVVFITVIFQIYCIKVTATPFVFLQQEKIEKKPATKTKDGQNYPILQVMDIRSPEAISMAGLLFSGMSRISLRLGQFTKNFIYKQIIKKDDLRGEEVFLEPLYIYVKQGGNRPKRGFYLENNDSLIDKTGAYYIELFPQLELFESIFAHENGHLIHHYLSEFYFKYSPNRFYHTLPAITDYKVAFNEGWGEHFEVMVADMTKNRKVKSFYEPIEMKGRAYFFQLQDFMNLAQKFKRFSWVKQNLFAFKRRSYFNLQFKDDVRVKSYFYNWVNPDFQLGRLKNAQQMLSCEGLISTLFYRIVTDTSLQNRYRDKKFYAQFFIKEQKKPVKEIISPIENIYLKLIYAKYNLFKELQAKDYTLPIPLMLELVKKYVKLFPEDANDILLHFCENTFFTTVWDSALPYYQNCDSAARLVLYDMKNARVTFKNLVKKITQGLKEIRQSPEKLGQYVGRPLWIENDKFVKATEKDSAAKIISINLNAAEDFELITIPGFTIEVAQEFVNYRDRHGPFKSIEHIKESKLLKQGQFLELKRMQELFFQKLESL
ncbi:ComEA family DNA-binding protein [Candidatus Riflebacteria bacterium]